MGSTFDCVIKEISRYEQSPDVLQWHDNCKKIEKIYRSVGAETAKTGAINNKTFNILWSNTQTILPAIYSRNPKPDVSRRFGGSDPVAREASLTLEKCLGYYADTDQFKKVMRQSVLDWSLYARGQVWVRYEPVIRDKAVQLENDVGQDCDDDGAGQDYAEPEQEVAFENLIADFVSYKDFGYNLTQDWDEVYLVWRKVRLSKRAAAERFGDDVAQTLTYDGVARLNQDERSYIEDTSVAVVYEVWDSQCKKVYFLQNSGIDFISVQDDPLGLSGFFPCPRPMFANLANTNLVPVPDYMLYASQAEQLELLTQRIYAIQKALKVTGVYDKSADGISKMVGGSDNTLHPVNISTMIERGGLDKMIYFFPLGEVSGALESLYAAFEQTKQHLYEITGIADILRGQGDAQETATGVRTKGQYALLRIEDKQAEAQRFVRDVIRIFGEIIAEKFSGDTIRKIAGDGLLLEQEKQLIAQGVQLPQLRYYRQDEIATMMQKPSFDDVLAMLRDEPARCMRIDIETDSTIKQDQIQDKNERMEFMNAVSGFMQNIVPAVQQQPNLAPVLSQLFMFGVRGFSIGKDTEQALSDWCATIVSEQNNNNGNQEPSPEQQKLQLEQQKIQGQMELEKAKMQNDMAREREQAMLDIQVATETQSAQSQDAKYQNELEHQRKIEEMRLKHEYELQKLAFERWNVEQDNATKLQIAAYSQQSKTQIEKK